MSALCWNMSMFEVWFHLYIYIYIYICVCVCVCVCVEMDTMTRVQILNKFVYISYCTNTLKKGMTPTILSPVLGKY